MAYALQRYRATANEQMAGHGETWEKVSQETWPWVFGDKCPLSMLTKVLDDVGTGKFELDPHAYYNFRFILYRFAPEILTATNIVLEQRNQEPIPEFDPPSVELYMGWD